MNGISVAGEAVSAATALAGLILVYLGSLASGFSSFQPQEKKTVQAGYAKRAWFAFVALLLALAAAALGVLGKWLPCEWVADVAVLSLFVAFVCAIVTAYLTVKEIK